MALQCLPEALQYAILKFCDLRSIGALGTVSPDVYKLVNTKFLWRHLCLQALHNHLPLRRHGLLGKDWKRTLRRWTWRQARWVTPQVDVPRATTLAPRYLHRATCGANAGDRSCYIFGGQGRRTFYNDIWTVSLEGGRVGCRPLPKQTDPAAPEPAPRCASSWTALGDSLYMFGGYSHSDMGWHAFGLLGSFFDDTWRLNLKTGCWSRLLPSDTAAAAGAVASAAAAVPAVGGAGGAIAGGERKQPCGRWGHSAVAFEGSIVVFAGSCPGQAFNDLWALERVPTAAGNIGDGVEDEDCFAWREIEVQGPRPPGRGGHSATVLRNHLYIFGGNSLEACYSDLWRIDLRSRRCWEQLTPPSPLLGASSLTVLAALGGAGDVSAGGVGMADNNVDTVASGGDRGAGGGTGGAGGVLDLFSAPEARIGHAAIALGDRIIVFGGRNFMTGRFCDGVHAFDTVAMRWERLAVEGAPPVPRTGHGAIATEDGILFFGGLSSKPEQAPLNDFVLLDLFN